MQMSGVDVALVVMAALVLLAGGAHGFRVRVRVDLGELLLRLCDRDGDGRVTSNEFAVLVSLIPIDVDAVFDAVDADADAFVDKRELDLLLRLTGANVIRLLDSDGDGKVSVNETPRCVHLLLASLPHRLLDLFDVDEDRKFDEAELDAVGSKMRMVLSMVPGILSVRVGEFLGQQLDTFGEVFEDEVLPMMMTRWGRGVDKDSC